PPGAATRTCCSRSSALSCRAHSSAWCWARTRARWCIVDANRAPRRPSRARFYAQRLTLNRFRGVNMIPELKKSAEQKMNKTVETLKHDYQKVRTGRAHTGLLDHIQVDYYGSMMPINQVAHVTLADVRPIGGQ